MKFTTRELLLVTAMVALAVGWWVDRSRLAAINESLENWRQVSASAVVFRQLEEFMTEEGYQFRWDKGHLSIRGPKGEGWGDVGISTENVPAFAPGEPAPNNP